MKTKFFITAAVLAITMSASAQQYNNYRDENRRIRHGAASGQLTPGEAARLRMREADLRRDAIRYRANDGYISRKERVRLIRDERKLDRSIYRQRHDCQRRRF